MGQLDDTLFAVLARQAKQRLGEFNAQELANTAWGQLKLGWVCTPGKPPSGVTTSIAGKVRPVRTNSSSCCA